MKKILKYFSEKRARKNEEIANDLFQVKEYSSEIWLTYNGNLVCPASMLKDDIVMALGMMRSLYIMRNGKNNDTNIL